MHWIKKIGKRFVFVYMLNLLFLFNDFLLSGGTDSRKGSECQGRGDRAGCIIWTGDSSGVSGNHAVHCKTPISSLSSTFLP